jgi:hypothetical protein
MVLIGGFNHLKTYESQWEGLSHILWEIKNVWNHQPVVGRWCSSSNFCVVRHRSILVGGMAIINQQTIHQPRIHYSTKNIHHTGYKRHATR